jgi:hypothetical protein
LAFRSITEYCVGVVGYACKSWQCYTHLNGVVNDLGMVVTCVACRYIVPLMLD